MRPALDERTAPDQPSGAVSFHPTPVATPTEVTPLSGRDFWRAVTASLLATLRPWSR